MGRVTNTESFIKEATLINGDRYDYSKVVYIKSNQKVEIVCKKHGSFWQRPTSHMEGTGCPKCCNIRPEVKRDLKIARQTTIVIDGKRKCSQCGKYLDRNCFYNDKRMSDGLLSACKDCHNASNERWEHNNIEKATTRRKQHRKKRWLKFKEEHKEEFEQRAQEREQRKKETKIRKRIAGRLRWRIRDALKKGTPRPHLIELLGCSLQEFKVYLESMWTEGMSWDNFKKEGWWIDHIRPCASFDLTNIEEQKKCFHWSNQQPMWPNDNIKKSSWYEGIRW